ncbi:MAG: glycoside hydrolase family 99-like domain-containing protein, partial [Oscillospiraceae bacterium]|nr:glycoside hydrolase family 99-like domain-containing protein [Oscillospiraceae bacterium]
MKIIKIIIKSIYRAARGVYRFVLPRCLRKRIYSFTVKASIRFKRSLGFEDPAVLLRYDSYETTICEREDTVRELASVIEKRDLTIKSQAETINEYKMYASSVHEAGKKSGDFVTFKENNIELGEEDVKLIACYLPQFHAIPENDEWWGKGFTEWTNVTKAMPHFAGHYQPHLPLEAFYDLSDINVMKWQVRLAQNYGVHGFMFHYYWFSGRKLLEKPLDNFFAAKADLDFPFCINWANHNWTRVWEAGEKDILLKQSYSEQDDLALISDIARYMKDKRYIRVFGKPLVSIYNAGSLPDPNQTIKIWRDYCRQNGIGEIHIVGMDSDMCNPLNYDFDGAIAQSPHDVSILFHDRLHSDLISKNGSRVCNIYDMKKYIREKMYLTDGREKFYRGLIPTFDNTARRINDAFVFDVSPALYKKWLGDLIVDAKKRFESGNRFVFINAWNEWAEGAHLEPDRRFGYAYLQATADALTLPPDDDTDDTDEPPDDDDPPCEEPGGEVNHIAFYLPQYHPFAENDKWWGDGFTDWVNVKKAAPMFDGHDQPRIPGELGYYDLRQKETIKRQMDMARRYGVYGFCIYYYWFDGKILMETPLKLIMENPELDLPFCLCWANENWSRRWDGKDDDVLLAQRYEKGFAGRFIRDVGVYMKDARYIRVNSKPMLAVYDAGRIPNIEETLREWRAYCREAKIGEIHILAVDFALPDEAANAGFDGFIEFPPHSLYDENRQTINEQMDNLSERFCGKVFDYAQIVKSREYMNTRLPNTHKGIFLSWDNTARRKDNPTIFHRFSIEQYSRWLRGINIYTKKHFDAGNRFVFINAWNEWAEGTYLEPDALYGYAALEEIAAVTKTKSRRNKSIIVAGHDANLYGAQLLSLNIVRQLKEVFGYDVYVIVKHGGSLAGQFKETSKGFLDLSGFDMRDGKLAEKDGRTAKEEITRFIKSSGAKKAICNTSVVGDILEILTENGIECISLIHETENMLYKYSGTEILQSIINHAKHIVFACEYVKKSV